MRPLADPGVERKHHWSQDFERKALDGCAEGDFDYGGQLLEAVDEISL